MAGSFFKRADDRFSAIRRDGKLHACLNLWKHTDMRKMTGGFKLSTCDFLELLPVGLVEA